MVTQDMKTVFMGTPDFAVPPLKALVEAGYEVAAGIADHGNLHFPDKIDQSLRNPSSSAKGLPGW